MFHEQKPAAVLFCILFILQDVISRKEGGSCIFEGTVYEEGESWTFDICTKCSCGEEGKVTCQGPECPRLQCENQHILPGDCCSVCLDNLPTIIERPIVSPPPGHCIHADILRHHGEFFPSTSSAVRPTSENQCVLCHCMDTRVLCHLKTCPETKCQHPVRLENDCCKTCPGEDIFLFHSTEAPNPVTPHSLIDCHFGGKVYKNSARWHHVVATFGRMDCIVCQCLNAVTTCERLKCRPEKELPCREPKVDPEECCKSCHLQVKLESRHLSTKVDSSVTPDRPDNYSTSAEALPTDQLPVARCPGRSSEVLVYGLETKTRHTLVFYHTQKKKVEKLTWTIDSGQITEYRRNEGTLEPFQQLKDYKLLGATRTRRLVKFKQRMKRLMEKCRASCPQRILDRKIRRLPLRDVDRGDRC